MSEARAPIRCPGLTHSTRPRAFPCVLVRSCAFLCVLVRPRAFLCVLVRSCAFLCVRVFPRRWRAGPPPGRNTLVHDAGEGVPGPAKYDSIRTVIRQARSASIPVLVRHDLPASFVVFLV